MGLNSTRTKNFNYVCIQIKSLMIGTLVARVFVQNHLRDEVYIVTSVLFRSLRSRRLEVVGERENGCARGRHARGFSCAHYFQAPATQANCFAGSTFL